MKTIICLGWVLLSTQLISAQTYRNAFDIFNNSIGPASSPPGQCTSMLTNCICEVSICEPSYLRGYLDMYKVTKDQKYMDQFAIHVQRIMDRRDDNLANIFTTSTAASFGFPFNTGVAAGCNITDIADVVSSSKSWSHNRGKSDCQYNEYETAQDGALLYPMAEFLYLMSTDSDFTGILYSPVPFEVTNTSSKHPLTYLQFAHWLSAKVYEGVDWWLATGWKNGTIHPPCGDVTSSGFYNDNLPSSNPFGQLNMQASMGSVLLWLDQLPIVNSQFSQHPVGFYQSRYIAQIATDIKNQISENACHPFTVFWSSDYEYNVAEDLAHGSATFDFANLCYLFGYTSYFNITWMQELGMTFATLSYQAPGKFNNCFSGEQPCAAGAKCGHPMPISVTGNLDIIAPYVVFTAYNPYIYSIISDKYAPMALYAPAACSANDPNIQGYAQLALAENTENFLGTTFRNIFNPVSISASLVPASSIPAGGLFYTSVTSGDFAGSGMAQVMIGTTKNELISSIVNPATKWMLPTLTTKTDVHQPIVDLLAGKFLGSSAGPDALIVIGANNDIDILCQKGSTMSSLLSAPFLTGLSITAATTGDFDPNHPGDEVLLLDNHSELSLVYFDPNNVVSPFTVKRLNLTIPTNQIARVTVGHYFNNSAYGGGAEFAVADNSGTVTIYSLSNTPWSLSSARIYTFPAGSSVDWDGIASGDFLGTGFDQVVTHSGFDGQFIVCGIDATSSQLTLIGSQAFPDGEHMPNGASYNTGNGMSNLNNFTYAQKWQNGLMAALKTCPGATNAGLVTLRNCDGQVSIFDMQGNCQGLQLSYDFFSDAVSNTAPPANYLRISPIRNTLTGDNSNYSLDYHAARIITATNDIVSANTNVNFIAGNEVSLGDGFSALPGSNFSATINPGLSCSPDVILPRTTSRKPPTQNPVFTNAEQTNSLSLTVQPNPNNGLFTLSTLDGKEGRLYIYNTEGELVYSNGDYSLNSWMLDLRLEARGIYWAKVITGDGLVKTQKIVHE